MKILLDKINLRNKFIFLIMVPFLGFLFISSLYINQLLKVPSNDGLTFAISFVLTILCITIFMFISITRSKGWVYLSAVGRVKGVFLDELDPNRGRFETEILEDCGMMCMIYSREVS